MQAVELLAGALVLLADQAELLFVCGPRLGENTLEPVDIALQPLALGLGRSMRLGQRGLELLDLGAKPVLRLGGRLGAGEALECVAELLLDPVALGGELVTLAGVALLCLGEGGVERVEFERGLFALLLQPVQVLLVRSLRLAESRFEPHDLGEQPILFGSRGLQALELGRGLLVLVPQPGELLLVRGVRLGEGGFEAPDLAAQLLQLRRIDLGGERRFRALRNLGGHFLGLRLRLGLGGRSLLGPRDLLGFHGFVGVGRDLRGFGLVGLACSRNRGGLRLLVDGCRLGGRGPLSAFDWLGARSRGRRDGRRRQPEPGEVGTRLLRGGLVGRRRGAEREAVFGPESAAALHRQRVRDRGAGREAELHDDLAERTVRLLLHLEDGRKLFLADEPELGHELTELALRHAFSLGRGAHARFPTDRRYVTPRLSAQSASNLNGAGFTAETLVRGMACAGVLDDDLAQDNCGVRGVTEWRGAP